LPQRRGNRFAQGCSGERHELGELEFERIEPTGGELAGALADRIADGLDVP